MKRHCHLRKKVYFRKKPMTCSLLVKPSAPSHKLRSQQVDAGGDSVLGCAAGQGLITDNKGLGVPMTCALLVPGACRVSRAAITRAAHAAAACSAARLDV